MKPVIKKALNKIRNGEAIILFDLDGTICDTTENKYAFAVPDENMIKVVNLLKQMGNKITVYTSRGSSSGIDYTGLIKQQLEKWGVQYDDLKQKPSADLIVDDMAVTPEDFFSLVDEIW
ncbi:MAG TPA: hypothetical protein ENI49_03990, partial [Thermoplasmatales archaeon]|nr:hypothetical protein [Thermoplasmatales archaeon]